MQGPRIAGRRPGNWTGARAARLTPLIYVRSLGAGSCANWRNRNIVIDIRRFDFRARAITVCKAVSGNLIAAGAIAINRQGETHNETARFNSAWNCFCLRVSGLRVRR